MILKYVDDTGHLTSLDQTNEQQGIVISPANLQALERVYGARTKSCRNRIINDILKDTIKKIETED